MTNIGSKPLADGQGEPPSFAQPPNPHGQGLPPPQPPAHSQPPSSSYSYSIDQSGPYPNPPSYDNSIDQSECSHATPPKSLYPDVSRVAGSQIPPNYGTGNGSPLANDYYSNSYQNQNQPNLIPPPIGSQSPLPQNNFGQKSIVDTYLLAFVFGLLGAHHFYLQRYGWGLVYLFTFGLLGCGYVIDLFRVPYLVRTFNRKHRSNNTNIDNQGLKNEKNLSDAYVAWFPFGLVGFHHYYLENYWLGLIFTFTFGIFGLGWLVDLCRMPYLVEQANDKRRLQADKDATKEKKSLWVCYLLTLPPMGWLGFHHFYMSRPFYGYAYILSFSGIGSGWLIDLFRMPVLLRRCNDEIELTRKRDVKTVDDCYVMWFPFGLIGFHHYYLGRIFWGVLYTFTFGLLGIGFLIDAVRIPWLVKEANRLRDEKEQKLVADMTHQPIAPNQSSYPGYNNNGNDIGSLSPTATAASFDHNAEGLPEKGAFPTPYDAPVPTTPPAYSVHNNDRSSGNMNEDASISPPPYKV